MQTPQNFRVLSWCWNPTAESLHLPPYIVLGSDCFSDLPWSVVLTAIPLPGSSVSSSIPGPPLGHSSKISFSDFS